MHRSAALSLLCLFACLTLVAGCSRCAGPKGERRTVWLAGLEVQQVSGLVRQSPPAGGPTVVELTVQTPSAAGTARSSYVATLDDDGLLRTVRYHRTGPGAERKILLTGDASGFRLRDEATGLERSLGTRPVVVLELLGYLSVARAEREVNVVDLASGEWLRAKVSAGAEEVRLEDDGGGLIARYVRATEVREGPGRFAELPAGREPALGPLSTPKVDGGRLARGQLHRLALSVPRPAGLDLGGADQQAGEGALAFRLAPGQVDAEAPTSAELAPELFIESEHPEVKAFAKPFARATASATALALAEEIHQRLTVSPAGGPPSALDTVRRFSGDCDNATALLVASLRSLGHPARAVVGYRVKDDTLIPHAWAEVYDGAQWLSADATIPGIGGPASRVRLFKSLGGALTMGRVLEGVTVVPVEAAPAAGP